MPISSISVTSPPDSLSDQIVTALEIRDVNHTYRKPALRGVSFLVGPGEFVLLLGLNGAGKTTLFSLIAGLLELQQGSIRVLGHELPHGRSAALAGCGFVFQQSALDLDLTVAQSLRYHGALHGLSRGRVGERIEQELERFGLVSRMNDLVRTLSGGQRRRVEIARALLHRPRLLLLDEATVGLDMPSRRAILQRVRTQCLEDGSAALWATHLQDEVEPGDRTIVLHEGRILDDRRDIAAASLPDYFARLASSETVA
jgi:ABC-2 type transport system ATP-binding protein